jgi:transcriptional regulator with XRE-family HTH domain
MQKSTNNLRQLRINAELTMDELSEKTGVPRSSIGAFEKGTRPLKPEHRHALESVLGSEIVEFSTESLPDRVEERPDNRYALADKPWKSAPTQQLEDLLTRCVSEKDYGAVGKVADELLNRKIQEKLK